MYLVSSPYMDKLYRQLIDEMPLIEKIDSLENHFIKKEVLYLIDERSQDEIRFLKSNQCLMKIFTEKNDLSDGIYKFQSVHKIIQQLGHSSNSWNLVVCHQIEGLKLEGIINQVKQFSPNAYVFDLTFTENHNFSLYDFKMSLENKQPFIVEKTNAPIRIFASIKDYAMPPLDLFQRLFCSVSEDHDVIIFTDSIKNPVDLYVLNHSKRVYILSSNINSFSQKYMERLSLGFSLPPKTEILTPDDFLQKIRLRRI